MCQHKPDWQNPFVPDHEQEASNLLTTHHSQYCQTHHCYSIRITLYSLCSIYYDQILPLHPLKTRPIIILMYLTIKATYMCRCLHALNIRAATTATFGIQIFEYLNEQTLNYLLTLIHTEFYHSLLQITIFSYSTHELLLVYICIMSKADWLIQLLIMSGPRSLALYWASDM